jgi:hypothetical protein
MTSDQHPRHHGRRPPLSDMRGTFLYMLPLIVFAAIENTRYDDGYFLWLSIRDDYRTLIGLDILGVVERYDDNEGVENSDV